MGVAGDFYSLASGDRRADQKLRVTELWYVQIRGREE